MHETLNMATNLATTELSGLTAALLPDSTHTRVSGTIGAIYLFMVFVTALSWGLASLRPNEHWPGIKQRIKSWWWIVGIASVAILLNRTLSLLFIGMISFVALKEYFSIIPTRRADRDVLMWAYLSVIIQYVLIGVEWYGLFIVFIPVYMSLLLPSIMVIKGHTKGFLKAAGTLQWGLMMTVFAVSHAAYLLVLGDGLHMKAGGAGLVLFLLLVTEINDVAQFVCGKSFGKHKVSPSVSPNKTWEGLLGGITITAIFAYIVAPQLTAWGDLSPRLGFLPEFFGAFQPILLGIVLGLAGFLGDVTVSAVKRDLGIKDTGALIPGHGGMLDRIDSLLFTAPLFFHLTRWFYP